MAFRCLDHSKNVSTFNKYAFSSVPCDSFAAENLDSGWSEHIHPRWTGGNDNTAGCNDQFTERRQFQVRDLFKKIKIKKDWKYPASSFSRGLKLKGGCACVVDWNVYPGLNSSEKRNIFPRAAVRQNTAQLVGCYTLIRYISLVLKLWCSALKKT